MKTTMNLAVVGVRHSHIFPLVQAIRKKPETSLSGWWEEDPRARTEAIPFFPEPLYDSYEELLQDPSVSAIALGDYYGIRGTRILEALRAGKHVLSDKPVCTSLMELEEIDSLCRKTGLKVSCMLDLRYDAALRLAAALIRQGELGEIHSVSFTGQHPLNWGSRPSWYFEEGKHGGTFNDIAIHGLDAVQFVTGLSYTETLSARAWNAFAAHAPDFCDSAQLMGKLRNGAGLLADVSYSAPAEAGPYLPSYWRFTFWGSKGWLECRYGDGYVSLAHSGDAGPYTLPAAPVGRDVLDDFLDEVRGQQIQFNTQSVLDSARTVLQIQQTADKSAKERSS